MGWIILVLLGVGAFFLYSYLVALEKEIRAEIDSPDVTKDQVEPDSDPIAAAKDHATSLDHRIESIVKTYPGILQSKLYAEIPEVERKTIQKALLDLDRSGKILRKRSGNSFKLALAD